MKRTIKRFIMLSFVLALVLSAAAFAAEPAYYKADESGEYSVDYSGNAGDYYALLVVEGVYTEEMTPVISENTVQHIDQATADANGTASFENFVPKTTAPGTVYVGGGESGPELLGYVNTDGMSKPVSIDVLAGDKVYLQNGTITEIAQDGTYTVVQDGVVVVNSGMESQKIYVVDTVAATATLTASDAVVGTDLVAIRNETPHTDGNVYSGVRFKMTHNPATKSVLTEYGFIMTVESNKVINGAGADYELNKAMVDAGYAKLGVAWSAATGGSGKYFDNTDDEKWIISGVLHNIPLDKKSVKTTIASRPYAVYEDGTYVYGEVRKISLYDACKEYEAIGFAGCSDEDIKFIKKIIDIVETKDIYIDISGLYSGWSQDVEV